MKMQTMIATALLTAGLGFGAVGTPANAASWHKGTPSALKGHWRTKMHKATGSVGGSKNYHWTYLYYSIIGSHVTSTMIQSDSYEIRSTRFKYLGDHTYKIVGKESIDNKLATYTIHKRSKKALTIGMNGYNQTVYKFSGRISKHTLYPFP